MRKKRGQKRYIVRACWWDLRHYGIRKAWNHFWTYRWYWSYGKLGPVPIGKTKDYWKEPYEPFSV